METNIHILILSSPVDMHLWDNHNKNFFNFSTINLIKLGHRHSLMLEYDMNNSKVYMYMYVCVQVCSFVAFPPFIYIVTKLKSKLYRWLRLVFTTVGHMLHQIGCDVWYATTIWMAGKRMMFPGQLFSSVIIVCSFPSFMLVARTCNTKGFNYL